MTTKVLTFRIPAQLYSQLGASAAELGIPIAAHIRRLIDQEYQAHQITNLRIELLARLDRLTNMAPAAPVQSSALEEILLLARATAAHLNPQLVAQAQARAKLADQQKGAPL